MNRMSELGEPVYRITLNNALAMRLTGYALVLFYVSVGLVYTLAPSGNYRVEDVRTLLVGAVGLVAVFAVTILLHELVHGIFMRVFGATPTYGVGRIGWFGFYAYAMAPGTPFTLMQMTVICLAPFVMISAATIAIGFAVPATVAFAAIAFITNFSGAAGDLWMVVQMWRFRRCGELRLVDREKGLDIHSPDPAASGIALALAARHASSLVPRILLRWLVTSTLMVAATVPLGAVLSMLNAGDVTIGPRQFALVTYAMQPDGIVGMTMDLNAIFIVSLACALLSVMVSRTTRHRARRCA